VSIPSTEKNILSFAQGTVIAREGDLGGDLFIIRSGVAEVFRERSGKEILLARVGAGEILGVMTATSGGPRSASVRAKTAVTAVKVERERVKELLDSVPKWAVALINDLVLRVTQTNELYEKSYAESESLPIGGRYLTLAIQVADGFVPLAETLSNRTEDKTVSVDEVLEKLSQIVNQPYKDLRKIIDVFDEKELVPWRGRAKNSRCTVGELDNFAFFSKCVKEMRSSGLLEELIAAFGIKERKLLRTIAETGEKHLTTVSPKQVTISLKELEEALRFQSQKFEPHLIKIAEHHKLIKQIKNGEDFNLEYQPRTLRLTMISIETVIAMDHLEESSSKLSRRRSLVY
jgi:CRP-like cAMP-binding protein